MTTQGGRVHTHTQARLANVDDVSFMRALISHAASSYGADPHAVFVTGQSNGGHVRLRLSALGLSVAFV